MSPIFDTKQLPMNNQATQFFRKYTAYCLDRLTDTLYQPLDRDYQPLGHPFRFERKPSTKEIMELSYYGDSDASRIYLYDDGCKPKDEPLSYIQRIIKMKSILYNPQ